MSDQVYLVHSPDYSGDELFGICSSKEEAEFMVERLLENKRISDKNHIVIDSFFLNSIVEY